VLGVSEENGAQVDNFLLRHRELKCFRSGLIEVAKGPAPFDGQILPAPIAMVSSTPC